MLVSYNRQSRTKETTMPGGTTVATAALIDEAERELCVVFPVELRAVWLTHNGIELPGGWRFFPVFDPGNPRKTAGSVTYENLRGAWGMHLRSLDLVALASNGTGNHLVMRVVDGVAIRDILHWNHETEKLTRWKPGIDAVMRSARTSAERLAAIRATLMKDTPRARLPAR